MKGVELEGEGPTFGIGIVSLKNVAPSCVGPLLDRLTDDADVEER
jgi:hypothetical protein